MLLASASQCRRSALYVKWKRMVGLILNNWLLWSVPLATISLILLLVVTFKLVNKMKRAELFSMPLVQETLIEFKEGGSVQIHFAGPRFTSVFAGLRLRLVNASNNQAVRVSRRVAAVRSSGISEARASYGTVIIPEAGRYMLSVQGLERRRDCAGCRLIFTHPYLLYAVACIIGMVLSGGGFIFGLVMSLIYLKGAEG